MGNSGREGMMHDNFADERWLTVAEVAVLLSVSQAWVRDHVTRRRPFLPGRKVGKFWRFRASEMDRFLNELSEAGKC
jgi:excisionase family DNA binding protein